jgi:hypothetical protein
MLIRVVKRLPAPMMDGFDVRRFQAVDQVYAVDTRLGRYLIIAGYALEIDETTATILSKPEPLDT